tara:strand:+ start:4284 stop:4712 length:429 start_codon:yes stop_codon:yes gene_type:complete
MKELDFQARLVKETKINAGFGFKIATRHQAGIPDLFIKWPQYDGVFIECKKASNDKLELGLTALQRETIERLIRAGQPVGWALLFEPSNVRKIAYVGSDPATKYAIPSVNCDVVTLSNPWPVDEIIKSLWYWHDIARGRYER